LPSGRNAIDQGLVSLVVMVSTVTGGEGFEGAGAPVWPGKAGFGFLGTSPAKGLAWACTRAGARSIEAIATDARVRRVIGVIL
jgi:hypothetical protein